MNIESIINNEKYKIFLNDSDTDNDDDTCLITQDKINSFNKITLPCNHTFDYKNLITELYNQKFYFYKIDKTNISSKSIKCPYCRTIYDNLLPYYEIDNLKKINGINYPNKDSMKLFECSWKYKSGKNKGFNCSCSANKYKIGNYCEKHYNYIKKKEKEESNYKKCSYIFKTGKNKGKTCNCLIKDDNFTYCKRQEKIMKKEINI